MPPPVPTARAVPASSSRRWWTLVVVGLAQLMVVLDATVVNIALPSAQSDLGFSDGDRQWVITAYSLAFGGLLLLGGRVSDAMGRKRAFVVGLVGFAASSALGGAAGGFGLLVVARVLQGAFAALLAPTALAVLITTFTIPKERARAFGVFGATAGAGGALGLLLGGALTQSLSWRWTLYINVAIAVIAVVGAVLLVDRGARTAPRRRPDIAGAVTGSAAVFALVYGLAIAETDGWGAPRSWGSLVVAGALAIGFVVRQHRAADPLLPLSVVVDRNRGAAYLAVLITGAGMFGVFLFVTYYLQSSLHYSPVKTGLAFLPMITLLTVASQVSTNVLLPRLGPQVVIPVGMCVAAAGMAYLTRLDLHSAYAASVLPPLVLLGSGMGLILPASVQTATLGIDPRHAGVASALVNTSQQVGGSIGTALLSTIFASSAASYAAGRAPVSSQLVGAEAAVHGYATVYWCGAALFAGGAALVAVLFRARPASIAAAPTDPGSTDGRQDRSRTPGVERSA